MAPASEDQKAKEPVGSSYLDAETSTNFSEQNGKDPLYSALLGDRPSTNLDSDQPNTLNEPILESLKRDAKMVYGKASTILSLRDPQSSLTDWDLWGPLFASLLISITLASTVSNFTTTFVTIWFGAALITVNTRLLGYRVTILPTISFLGYCLVPLGASGLLLMIMPRLVLFKVVLVGVGVVWSALAGMQLLEMDPALEDRRLLAATPLVLFFFIIAWFHLIS